MFGKRNAAALVAEFLGTTILTLLILSVQRSQLSVAFFIAASAGLAFALISFIFGRVSGGHFNPAITIGLWTVRKVTTIRAVMYIAVQLLGGVAAYYLFTYFIGSEFKSIGGDYSTKVLVAEAVGTMIFSMGIAAAVYQSFNRAASASMTGLALMVGIVGVSAASLGLLNPAVALGVKAWVWGTYVVGPIIGAIIGINLYARLFAQPEAVTVAEGAVGPTAAATVKAASKAKSTKAKKPAAKRKTAAKKK
jgi:glycerol uptake facilitator-like aquaporin